MANQNFRVGVSIDLTQARAQMRRLESEFQRLDLNLGDLRGAAKDLDLLRRAVERLDRSFNKIDFVRIDRGFDTVAGGVRELRRVLFPGQRNVDEMSRSLDALSRNAHQAERALHGLARAQRTQTRAGRVGAGGRQAARSGGTPIGFAGFGGALGFLGVGGVGARFAIGAGVIAGITALGFALAEATRRTAEFVAATATLSAEFDFLIRRANILAGGGALSLFSDAALEQGKRTIFTANEAAEALGELARAGFDTEESVAALPGVLDLAATDSLELADATLIVARTLRAFRLDAEAAGVVADVLAQTAASTATSTTELAQGLKFAAPFAAQLGIPLQEVAAAMGILGDNGIVAGIAGRNLRFAFRSLIAPTDTAQEAITELGLRTTTASGQFVSFRSVIGQLVQAQQEIGNSAEFAGLVTEAFGTRASGSILTLVENFDAFREATTENFLAFGRAAEIAEEQLSGLEGALERLRGETEAQRIEGFQLSGLQAELTQFARELDTNMNAIFGAIVDPIFREIAVGANLIRNETLPGILAALPGIGENAAGIIGSIFDFLADRADTVVTAIESISVAIQGIVDTFIGLGVLVAPVIDTIGAAFNALPDEISSGLTGALTGAGIGALFFGAPGAVIGGFGGFLAGAVGAAFEASPIPRQAAEYGVELGTAVTEGLADGLDLIPAINAAIEAGTEPGTLQASNLDELIANVDTAEARLRLLEDVASSVSFDLLGNNAEEVSVAFGLTRLSYEELMDEISTTEENLEGARAAFDQLTQSAEVQAEVLSQVAQAEEILAGIRSRAPNRAADFFVIRDPAEILQNIATGAPLAALGKRIQQDAADFVPFIGSVGSDILRGVNEGVAVPVGEANRLIERHVRELTGTIRDEFIGISTELVVAQGRFLDSLEGFGTVVQNALEGFGSSFRIGALPEVATEFTGVSGLDFSAVFEPPSPDEIEEQIAEAEAVVVPTVRSSINALFDTIEAITPEIGQERATGLRSQIRNIFADGDLTLGEQAIAGAFLVDQAFAQQQAEDFVAQLETVLARIEELSAEAAIEPFGELDLFALPEADRLAAEEFLAGRTTELANQATILADLVASGDIILANAAATSDTVLSSLESGFARVEELKTQAEGIQERLEVQVGIVTSDEEFAAAQVELDLLAQDVGALGPAIAEGLETDLSGIPGSLVDPFIDGVGQINSFLDIGSPSGLFEQMGGFLVEGLSIGWSSRFPSFSALVISNFATLINTIENMFRNVNLTTPAPTVPGGIPGTVRHGGGYVPGFGEVPITALGGEFVLRRGAVEGLTRLGIDPTLLNRDPRVILHQPTTNTTYDRSNQPMTVNQNFDIHTTATSLNERRLMREAERQLVRHAKRGL